MCTVEEKFDVTVYVNDTTIYHAYASEVTYKLNTVEFVEVAHLHGDDVCFHPPKTMRFFNCPIKVVELDDEYYAEKAAITKSSDMIRDMFM